MSSQLIYLTTTNENTEHPGENVTIEHDLRRLADAAERIAAALEGRAAPVAAQNRSARPERLDPDLAVASDLLRHAEHLAIVTTVFPNWKHGAPPSVRAIKRAIHEARQAVSGGEFASNDVAHTVQRKLLRLRERPELLSLMKAVYETNS